MSRYMTETPQYSAQVVNSMFINKVAADPRSAALEGTAFTRDKIREEASIRHILPPILLKPEEIDRRVEDDQPIKIIEKEPDSIAYTMPIRGSARARYFKGPRYRIDFYRIESEKFKKKKAELMTYQNDIRKILADNIVKDMAEQEDRYALRLFKAVVDAGGPSYTTSGAFKSTLFAAARKAITSRKVPAGVYWITDPIFSDALTLPASEVGYTTKEDHYRGNGVEKEDKLFGIPVVRCMRPDAFEEILGANTFLLLAPENFLGKFFLIQDATLFIKQEADDIEFFAYEILGMGVGNHKSVQAIEVTQA